MHDDDDDDDRVGKGNAISLSFVNDFCLFF